MVKTFADFCAGIGAGRLGLEKNNLRCVAYSEIDKRAIYTYNHLHDTKGELFCGDLTKVDCSQIPDFDIMVAGFPCQTLGNFVQSGFWWHKKLKLMQGGF